MRCAALTQVEVRQSSSTRLSSPHHCIAGTLLPPSTCSPIRLLFRAVGHPITCRCSRILFSTLRKVAVACHHLLLVLASELVRYFLTPLARTQATNGSS